MTTSVKSAAPKTPVEKAAHTARWATTMTKVGIRQALSKKPFPRWHFVEFAGKQGAESRGIVDLVAIRKDHSAPVGDLKRGDSLDIVFIQVKGGSAARPTDDDAKRLRTVKQMHKAKHVLLATWKKGHAAKFFTLRDTPDADNGHWNDSPDLKKIFCNAAN
jgi:hypothetical protein